MSSSHPLQQHQQPQPSPSQRTAEARAAFTASLNSVGSNLDADLRARAANLHENAAALSKQETELKRATADLARQNVQWQKVTDQAREGLKEIGDVQNWAELIERDLLIVEETLRLVESKGKKQDAAVDGDVEGGAAVMDGEDTREMNGDSCTKNGQVPREGGSRWRWW